jgi:dTDP-4-amino-4,6-dideoxygalactose transaminase
MSTLAIHGGSRAAAALRVPEWPQLTAGDRQAVIEVLDSRQWGRLYSNSRAEQFERAFAAYHDANHGIAVSNGTVAIELALLAAGIRPGDEVLVPSLTFIATASAVVRVGAIPIFVDMEPGAGSLSPVGVEAAIGERTRAIVAVHYGGYPADLDAIGALARHHGLVLIEDCAHAQGTTWRGRKAGSIGHMGTFSFQQSKALSSGEGGIVITNDAALAERATLLHDIGRVRGRSGAEHWVCASDYRIGEFQAALLLSSLGRLQSEVERREANATFLREELQQVGGLMPLRADERITQRGFYFLVLRYDAEAFAGAPRDRFVQALRAEGVPCGIGYDMPVHAQPAFRREHLLPLYPPELHARLPDYEHLELPEVAHFCARQIVLPHEVLLAERAGMEAIVAAVTKIRANAEQLEVVREVA